jgi:anti-sigma factor RsiW
MRIWRRPNTPSERELVGLADGSLRGQRRAEIESALESRPDLRSAVAAQRRVLEAIERADAEPAPHALRARLALARPPARARGQRRTGGLIAAGTAGLAAVVAGIVVGVSGGGAVAQASVLQAAALSSRAPQHAVSQARTGSDALPGVHVGSLSYPYWDRFGYRAAGVRRDRLAGQEVTTVVYRHGSSRVAYAIVAGSPLRLGAAAGRTVRGGLVLRTFKSPGGPVVTWTRHGHTCVLVGQHTALPALLKLASWREGGRIPY